MNGLLGLGVFLVCLGAATSNHISCYDTTAACAGWKQYCTVQKYVPYMRQNCRATCGWCTPTTTVPPPPMTQKPSSGQCGLSPVKQTRVVNGFHAKEGAWPWLASLQMNGRHWCGGTLITPTWVLTAAHCVQKPRNPTIKMGAHDHSKYEPSVQNIPVKRIIPHPQYNKISTLNSDFALIELARPATLNQRVELACLPKATGVYPKHGANCYVAGWGSIKHPGPVVDRLQQARLPVVDVKKCKWQLEVVCAGYGTVHDANACRGDSGGPFVCQQSDGSWVLEGVASYVVEYCKYYTGFSPVSQYLPWIRSYIGY